MIRRLKSFTIALSVLGLAGAIYAADPKPLADSPTATNIPENLKEYYYSGLAPEKLSYAIDLWYDAVLKGDDGKASRYEFSMLNIVRQDIDSTGMALAQFEQYYHQTESEALRLDSTAPHGAYLPVLEKLDQDIYSEIWKIYKTKQQIFDAIQHSAFPSNKYRLITDYIDVLRRQIGLPRLKVVYSGRPPVPTPQGQQGSSVEN